MFDINAILKGLQDSTGKMSKGSIGAGAGAAGLATGLLMGKSGRKMLGKATKYGAAAAIGGLAHHAWMKSRQGAAQPSAQPLGAPAQGAPAQLADADYEAATPGTVFLPSSADEAEQDRLGQSLVRAMIAAAKADGKIDAEEKEVIFARLNTMDLDAGTKAFVFDELSSPLNLDAVVKGADSPERAAEIYAASLVAIEADTVAEKAYLQMLAARLELAPALVAEIHAAAGAAAPA